LPAEAARKEIKIDGEVLAIGLVRV
jgi:hypothetical protein